ncbi:hypothetical protein GCM10027294_27630 [Marinactinospora endophytica]
MSVDRDRFVPLPPFWSRPTGSPDAAVSVPGPPGQGRVLSGAVSGRHEQVRAVAERPLDLVPRSHWEAAARGHCGMGS